MGLDQTVRFPTADAPSWGAIRAQLQRVGESGQLRMIDGLPAFPDEEPADGWSEVRVGTAAGMITVRRRPGALVCVTWGNSDPALSAAWGKVTWACAAAGEGTIETPTGSVSAAAFATAEGIAPV